jgi:2,3-bisphosphoglycerate-dependent phosphoglycerate mutase
MLPPGDEAPDSESMYEATVRCVAYWSGTVIPSIIAGKNVLVVAHGDILRMLTGHLLGMSEADIVRFPVLANATPTVLDLDDDLRVRSRHSLMDTELNEPV